MNKNNYGITKDTILTDEIVVSICLCKNNTKMKSVVSSAKWQEDHPEITNYLMTRYSDFDNLGEVLYRIVNHIDVRPTCPICGGRLHFLKFSYGFPNHCSVACLNKDKEHIEKCALTCVEKYGGRNPMSSDEVKEKVKATCLNKYGCEYSLLSAEVKEKAKETCIQKYGKSSYGQFGSEEYTELIRNKYGVDNVFLAESVKAKIKNTNLEKYGVEYISKSDIIKDKIKLTNKERYGAEYYLQTDDGKERVKLTMLERYGVEYMSQSEEFKEKIKLSNLEKYGVEYTSLIPEVREKFKNTCLERYGVEHVLQNPEFNLKVIDTKRKNHTFNTSKIELEFKTYLESKNYDIKTQYTSQFYPFCCDFYIPSLDLYIEINGTWTHGKHRFDPNSKEDLEILSLWESKNTKFYLSAIHTWTVRDPLKFKVAEENNLKYLPIYSHKLNECIKQFEEFIETIE